MMLPVVAACGIAGAVAFLVPGFSGRHSAGGVPARNQESPGTAPVRLRPLIGPGCGPRPASSAFPGTAGDGWSIVSGGPAECGGRALTTLTTPGTGPVLDTYTWDFTTSPAARCAVRVFVPSGGGPASVARYEVQDGSRRLGGFTIGQADHRGQWVPAGTWTTPGGHLRIVLTDQAAQPAGAGEHVLAAATTIGCTP
jgi:hypothetical protein